MKTKLTLRIEDELIDRAKAVARERNTSVSKLVAAYLRLLDAPETAGVRGGAAADPALPAILVDLHGCMRGSSVDEGDYQDYLSEKHA